MFPSSWLHRVLLTGLLALPAAVRAADASPGWPTGTRVIVEKAGSGHRAIVLQAERNRCFVAYENEDQSFDEWVETAQIRTVPPRGSGPVAPGASAVPAPTDRDPIKPVGPVPAPLPAFATVADSISLPRPVAGENLVPAWLEPLPRTNVADPLQFNVAQLPEPRFTLPAGSGVPSERFPIDVVFLPRHAAAAAGFAAIEGGEIVLYRENAAGRLERSGQLDTALFGANPLKRIYAGDLNRDGETDLVVLGGPILEVYFGTADGRYVPARSPYRSGFPVRRAALGRFFTGANPLGVAVVEGDNSFRLLNVTSAGLTPVGESRPVKFDRILDLVAGDFDGDGFTDLAIATETKGRSTGAWMYFNQNNTAQAFMWPVGGKDDFARALFVADLDHDGRDDLIMTDADADRGDRIRVVFGSAARSGWEDPWDLIGSELGVGLGTGSVVVGDFNHDGRLDIGVAGRNGLRFYLGAEYRRFSRNPAWPVLRRGGNFPDQRAYVAGDFNGDGVVDLLGYTPAFATGYNLVLNVSPETVAGTFIPPPLRRRAPTQASATENKIVRISDTHSGTPQLHFLASRAEPYGPYRYRIVVEFTADDDGVVQSVDGVCKYANEGPLEEVAAKGMRRGDQQWSVEVVLPRGRNYEFTLVAKDDKGNASEPLRVTVSP